jgi:L-rhamnose mutarotase
MKTTLSLILLLSLCFLSCKNTTPHTTRYAMVTGLRPEKIDEYKKLHASVWPDVLKMIKQCHIDDYSIYLKNIAGNWYLFSYFEYSGADFNADMQKMKNDSTTQRWWKETAPCQQPLPDAAAKGETWSAMEEVFHQP